MGQSKPCPPYRATDPNLKAPEFGFGLMPAAMCRTIMLKENSMPSATTDKQDRISIRLDSNLKERIERAALADNRSVSGFMIASALERADSLLPREETLTLSERDFDLLLAALDTPPKPNKALRDAVKLHRRMKIKSDA